MSWDRLQNQSLYLPNLSLLLDYSLMGLPDGYLAEMEPRLQKAYADMAALEKGEIANPDENRMVGHYWLRNARLAPTEELTADIEETLARVQNLATRVKDGTLQGTDGPFENVLVIGIGGSALGPQFVAHALGHPEQDKLTPYFFDNTDPDGIDLTLAQLRGQLGKTIAVVISKSGGTPETRNGMLEAEAAWTAAGLDFARHAIAVTGEGSKLDNYATEKGWLERFPMWDWVGGRTSETATVGLIPAALQGIDIQQILNGAADMDSATRIYETAQNPAALLALCWHHATNGKGEKDMVILPYKDRLIYLSKYLQQLVMESLGKEKDLDGNVVHQGIAVYGNKGSTDQHAYVQQLREGVPNFFATFIEVLKDRRGESIEVEPGATAGDFLQGFLLGTRQALAETGRASLTITVEDVSPYTVGMMIALYERAVGFYASLVNINAYHQPGVEAGKKAAAGILDLKRQVFDYLSEHSGQVFQATGIAEALNRTEDAATIFKLLEHLAANPTRGIEKVTGSTHFESSFRAVKG